MNTRQTNINSGRGLSFKVVAAMIVAFAASNVSAQVYPSGMEEQPPVLTVTKAGTGGGLVTSSPSGISCHGDCSGGVPHRDQRDPDGYT